MNKKNLYRATELWNEIVEVFRHGVPCKTHWWQLRRYENCFTGAEAATWLHQHLLTIPSIPQKVTRGQVILLLGKFLKTRIIERVPSTAKERDKFKDGSLLYRTVPRVEPLKPHNGAAPTRVPPQSLEPIPSTVVMQAWGDAVLRRLSSYLVGGLPQLQDLLDLRTLNGSHIQHNCCNQGRSGIVALKDKSEDLPPWVFSAMRCLAQWPSTSGLPNYPGFERDVYRTVRGYFLSRPQPLVPPHLTSLFLYILGEWQPATPPLGSMEDVMTSLLEHPSSSPVEVPCYETTFTTAQPTTRLLFRSSSVGRGSDLTSLRRRTVFSSANDLDNPQPIPRMGRRNFLRASLTASQRLARRVVRGAVGKMAPPVQATAMRVNGIDLALEPGFQNPAFCPDRSPPLPFTKQDCFVNPASQRLWKLEALQLATLLLPPPRRRHLHLLLRMLSKMVANDRLEPLSDDGMPMECLLVKTFQPAILRPSTVAEQQSATRLVQLMIAECEELFSPPLASLRSEVVQSLPGLSMASQQENLPPPQCSTPKVRKSRSPTRKKPGGGLTSLFNLRL